MAEFKRLPYKEFKSIYSKVPRLCVEVIVKTPKGIILTKRTIPPGIGQWHIPGGGVFKGESLHHAVMRSAQEELGIKVKIDKLLGVIEYPNLNYFYDGVGIAFQVSIKSGTPKIDANASEMGYFKKLPKNLLKDQKDFFVKTLHYKLQK